MWEPTAPPQPELVPGPLVEGNSVLLLLSSSLLRLSKGTRAPAPAQALAGAEHRSCLEKKVGVAATSNGNVLTVLGQGRREWWSQGRFQHKDRFSLANNSSLATGMNSWSCLQQQHRELSHEVGAELKLGLDR